MIPGGHGNLSDFILALEWALGRPEVQIVNMSAGLPGYIADEPLLSIVSDIQLAGVLSVFAIGNEGRNRTRSPGNYVEPLSVGASNRENRVAGFSGGGTIVAGSHQYNVPDLVAPGEAVLSSVVGGGYEAWDGTSMAAPIVSGVAALLLEKRPDFEVTELVETLLNSCRTLGLPADRQGRGVIQVGTPIWK
jgi:subtilisin family serine protease